MALNRKRTSTRPTRKEYFQKAVHAYMQEFGVTEVDPDEVAKWMCDTRKYEETPYSIVKRCKQELSRAMKDEMIVDPQGRDVRRMHCIRFRVAGETKSLWAPIYDAKPEHMRLSLQQRRRGIRGEVLQHHTDFTSYNDNNNSGAQLELFDYDFNKDVAEHSMPTDYPDDKPDDDGPSDGSHPGHPV